MSLCIKQKLKFSPPLEKCLYILIGPLLYKYNIYKFIRRINWRLNPSIIRSDTKPFLDQGKESTVSPFLWCLSLPTFRNQIQKRTKTEYFVFLICRYAFF